MPDHEVRVLIVEDGLLVGHLFESILTEDGYLVSRVGTGRAAAGRVADYDCTVAMSI